MLRRIVVVALAALLVVSSVAGAQQSPVHVGGTLDMVTQTHSGGAAEPLGGTAPGGRVVFGVKLSRRLAVEFEPSFGQPYSQHYSYHPSPSLVADVVVSRHDSFFSFQLRTRVGVLEPVAGVSYLYGRISRHATVGNSPYFDDRRSDDGFAFVGGLDAAVKLTSRLQFVPTFRLLARGHPATPVNPFNGDPLGMQTRTGSLAFRYGAGVRVTF